MQWHLHHAKKKDQIIARWGLTKFQQMQQLADSVDAIVRTRKTIIPGFIDVAIRTLRPPR
jgi:hypothetical protein